MACCRVIILALCCCVSSTSAYCWQVGWDPSFKGLPMVRQLALDKVEVSWRGLVNNVECADQFLVKYWRKSNPGEYQMTKKQGTDKWEVQIKVVPRVPYAFVVIAREDKGWMGADFYKAQPVTFATSSPAFKSETRENMMQEEEMTEMDGMDDDEAEQLSLSLVAGVSLGVLMVLLLTGVVAFVVVSHCLVKRVCDEVTADERRRTARGGDGAEFHHEEDEERGNVIMGRESP